MQAIYKTMALVAFASIGMLSCQGSLPSEVGNEPVAPQERTSTEPDFCSETPPGAPTFECPPVPDGCYSWVDWACYQAARDQYDAAASSAYESGCEHQGLAAARLLETQGWCDYYHEDCPLEFDYAECEAMLASCMARYKDEYDTQMANVTRAVDRAIADAQTDFQIAAAECCVTECNE